MIRRILIFFLLIILIAFLFWSSHAIAKIEVGATPNPTIATIKKIAGALGVSLDDLMK